MRVISVLVFALALSACSSPKPVSVSEGEACWRCRRPINNVRLAGELVAANGLASKFRTIHCMSTWIAQQKSNVEGTFYVTDYSTGKWVPADRATYVRVIVDRNTMEQDFVAFENEATAAKTAHTEKSALSNWEAVLDMGRRMPMGG